MNVYTLTEYTKIHKENTWIYIQLVENIEQIIPVQIFEVLI